MREVFKNIKSDKPGEFRPRGRDAGRIENFSDAVFALAITLLLISTSPPTNFEQMKLFVWELIPFSACIAVIMLIWYQHFIFFYRYGLRNATVLVINTVFLVIVLFYVYPLKYIAKGMLIPIGYMLGKEELLDRLIPMFVGIQIADLMIIYGLGYATVFLILAVMYRYAIKKSGELELNEIECFDTRTSYTTNLMLSTVPLISVIMAIVFYDSRYVGIFSGFSYFLYPPVMWLYGRSVDKKRKPLLETTTLS